ncbi:MAG TPA: hypothetical protein DEO83_01350 [Lachnospiraceae bacterium]|nr:hypothetical protein [Lachnospiraceae bacterium]
MTLLVTIFAAIFVTIKWYTRKDNDMKLEMLIFMYWGAALMWMIDAVFEFVELKAEFFSPAPMDMLNDAFLGLSVIALGLVVWMIRLLITDPKGVIRKSLTENK